MGFAGLEFEYHRFNGLPLSYCRFQRMVISAFRLYDFLRTHITLNRLLSKIGVRDLNSENQCVRRSCCVLPFGCCSGDMQAIDKQTVQRGDHIDQKGRWEGLTLTLRQGCAVQRWSTQLPSPLESGA